MPRFDHIKGEVSVRNLVWRQGGKQFSPGGEVSIKFAPHPAPTPTVLDAETKDFLSPKGAHPRQLGWGGGGSSD